MILGEDGPGLFLTPQQAYILRDAVRTWRADHERHGARQKLTPVLGVLGEWERVGDRYAQNLMRQRVSGSGRPSRKAAPISGPLTHEPLSTAEAGRRLGVSDRQVRRWINSGDLEATTVGRAKLVDPASVEQLKRQRRSA